MSGVELFKPYNGIHSGVSREIVNETHLGVFLKLEEPSCNQIHFSVITLCIVNKNDLRMSMTRNYANPIRKFGSDEFISFKVLLDSSLGYLKVYVDWTLREIQDLVVPALDMMRKEILTGGHRIIDRDSRIEHIQTVLAKTQRSAELAKIRFGEELTPYARGMENLHGDWQSLVEQIRQLNGEVWQLVGEKAKKDGRITHLEIENSVVAKNQIFCQDKLMEERSISARFSGFGLDLLSEMEIDKVLCFHAQKLEQTYEVIKQRRLGNQR
ncbi:hypothetical protein RHSIM_Rhsim01G0116700 [Rhododendron simsii]|uniref:Uncharacterized protein n=1 Tax=Rhododendron simsii TaxID=118357 RepID=A0A834HUT3_RHOSS|nr:hypothetical protein RHSIM_Rhsim01G0116700 [Rhododendron simsii]